MSQVVFRVQPVKSASALSGATNHNLRVDVPKASVDPTRTDHNVTLYGTGDIRRDVLGVVSQYPLAHKKSTFCAEMVLSAGVEYFDRISPGWREGKYTPAFEQWKQSTVDWLKSEFPGLAAVNLHMDEQAPHFHAFIVPVETKTIAFRRGEKEVTRIRYNGVFGDDASVIAQARREKNSELTKLGAMQSRYAKYMQPCGLQRGVKNSRARHTTIEEYQNKLAVNPVPKPRRMPPPPPPPTVADRAAEALGVETEHQRKMAEHAAACDRVRRENQESINTAFVKADAYQEAKEQIVNLRKLLIEKDAQLEQQGAELRQAKERVSALRALPLDDVLRQIGHEGPPPQGVKNAIDAVQKIGGLSFNESLAWLAHEFGADAVTATAAEVARQTAAAIVSQAQRQPQPTTAAERETRKAVERQMMALGAERYRITCQVADPEATPNLKTFNVGKQKDGTEIFYSPTDIIKMIPKLRRDNARGYSIFITAYSDKDRFLLLDDLTDDTLKALPFKPTLLQSSSRKSMQAVFRLPKSMVSDDGFKGLFYHLNRTYGDPKITGFNHPFRLAGFMNVKAKHKDPVTGHRPFVRILNSDQLTCGECVKWAKEFASETALQSAPSRDKSRKVVQDYLKENKASESVSDVLRRYAERFYRWIADRYGDQPGGPDYSRADWMLLERLAAQGASPPDAAAVLLATSPELEKRHPGVHKYVNQTLTNRNAGRGVSGPGF